MKDYLETASKPPIMPINPGKIPEDQLVGTLWKALMASMPPGWVFAGVMRRADAEFLPENSEMTWVAVATKEGNLSLGPVPTLEGQGSNAPGAMGRLLVAVSELKESMDEDDQC